MSHVRSCARSSRFAAARTILVRVATLALLVVAFAAGSLLSRPTLAHAQTQAPQQAAGLQPAATVQTPAQSGLNPRFDAFVRGPDGMLWHRWWEHGVWYDWENLNVPIDAAPAAVFGNAWGDIFVFYLRGGHIWSALVGVSPTQPSSIGSLEDLGNAPGDALPTCPHDFGGFCSPSPFTSAPAAVYAPDGHLEVFAFAGPHFLLHRWTHVESGDWSDWALLSNANFAGDPAVVAWGGVNLAVLVNDSDNAHLNVKIYDGSWHNWQDLGGSMLYSPAAASWGPGRIDAFVVGSDSQLWHKWYEGGQWSAWEGLGGVHTSSPSASSWGVGRIDVAARGTDDALWHKWYEGGQWSGAGTNWNGWQGLGGNLTSAPAVGDTMQVF